MSPGEWHYVATQGGHVVDNYGVGEAAADEILDDLDEAGFHGAVVLDDGNRVVWIDPGEEGHHVDAISFTKITAIH